MPERPSWTSSPLSPDGVRSFRQQLTVGEDAVDVAKWFPESYGIPPHVRVGRNRWFNLLWLLPIGFVVHLTNLASSAHRLMRRERIDMKAITVQPHTRERQRRRRS